jgi:hypothetical protein
VPFVLLALALAVVVVVPYVVNKAIRHRLDARCAAWEEWSKDFKGDYVVEFIRDNIEESAIAWRVGLLVGGAAIIFLGGQQLLIYNVAHESKDNAAQVATLAGENCLLSRNFLQDEADDATREIRALTDERDHLAKDIIDTPTKLTDIPGYFDAPFWFRQFLGDLLDQQVAEANQQLGTYDVEIAAARERRDEIQALLDTQECPRL